MADQNSTTKYDNSLFSYDDIQLCYDGEVAFASQGRKNKGDAKILKTRGNRGD